MTAPVSSHPPPAGPFAAAAAGGVLARGVRRTFRGSVAVDAVDLDVPPGQVTALIGPNGSGKTTLLLVLAGLLVPDAGAVTVAGVDLRADPVTARARVGWMPDVHGTWDSLTSREVLATVADAYRMPRDAAAARVGELLEVVHLTEFADRPAHVLSRGQKQRLGLARAIVHSPAVLLLDEPASGLDPRSRVELRDTLRALAASGAAVLVSSHVLAELDELADRAVFVAHGRTVDVREDVQRGGTGGAAATARRYRLRALDDGALARALADLGAPGTPVAGGTDVVVATEAAAADLVARLVGAGVPLVSFAPAAGALEQVYLDLDDGERR